MKPFLHRFLSSVIVFFLFAVCAFAEEGKDFSIIQHESAQIAYDKGFAKQVMRAEDGGVRLWNRMLVENDSPGSGSSNKGNYFEPVFGDRRIKKILTVDDPACEEAYIVFIIARESVMKDKPALDITVNESKTSFSFSGSEPFGYISIDPSWLKKGKNVVTFACPDAQSALEGYPVLFSRKDELVPGDGDPWKDGIQTRTRTAGGIDILINNDPRKS